MGSVCVSDGRTESQRSSNIRSDKTMNKHIGLSAPSNSGNSSGNTQSTSVPTDRAMAIAHEGCVLPNNSLTSSLIPSNSVSVSTKLKMQGVTLQNNTSDKHLNTMPMHELLCFGWIRSKCRELADSAKMADSIPLNVLNLCFDYFYIERILFCFIASETEKISAIQAIDVNNIYETQYKSSNAINIGYDTNGICIDSSGMHLPSGIPRRFNLLDTDS